ncbi:MAG: LLM class flavin-dependent oxidoreductase [Chloroflexia bacterium]|nr:LLM class flavin-dependent oxidoreductase [Chloroflexia bacterium]
MAPVRFGYCLPIFANPTAGLFRTPNYDHVDARLTLDLGKHAENLGFDSLWVADHLMLGRDEAILEGWTILSALGGVTSRAQLGMIHQGHYFREPGLAAKMTATLDQLTGGRFVMFYDYGQQLREHRAYHFHYPDDVDQRVAETIDGIRLIRDLWNAEAATTASHGAHGVTDATCTPTPVRRPHPPIWFGETHPGLLAACAEFGQGWNTTPCGVDEFGRRLELLRAACSKAQRDVAEIEASVELQVLIAPEGEARSVLGAILEKAPDQDAIDPDLRAFVRGAREHPPASLADTTLIGAPEQVRTQLQAYVERGANHFLLWFLDAPDRTGMALFAREVAPVFSPGGAV